jgi:two-component system CheB/CheR fusion protein
VGEEPKRPSKKRRSRQPATEQAPPSTGSRVHSCPIAGIGASAGGLEVFSRLLRALPDHIGIAIVLVQHLDPTQESMLADILGRQSKMPVLDAEDGMLAEPDHVYVMPAGVTMEMKDGAFSLKARAKPPVLALPIDTLLRSMAEDCGSQSIGVVLSGTGSDGVIGLGAIKEAGGLTFAQDPDSAEYDGMPRAAIDAGVVDAVLDPEHLAAELTRIGVHPRITAAGRTAAGGAAGAVGSAGGSTLGRAKSCCSEVLTQRQANCERNSPVTPSVRRSVKAPQATRMVAASVASRSPRARRRLATAQATSAMLRTGMA